MRDFLFFARRTPGPFTLITVPAPRAFTAKYVSIPGKPGGMVKGKIEPYITPTYEILGGVY